MRCMLSEPPTGELPNICASMSPAGASFGKYSAPCSTRPVVLIQLSTNTACICATTGPSALKCESRQGGRPMRPSFHSMPMPTPPRESDLAIDDEQLAVGAIVEATEVIPGGRVVDAQVAAGGARGLQQMLVHGPRSQPVEQHVHLHAAARRVRQFLDECGAHAIAEHESLEGRCWSAPCGSR